MRKYGIEKNVIEIVRDKIVELDKEKKFDNHRVVLFGITEASNVALEILRSKNVIVEAIIDNNPSKKNLVREEVQVCSPKEKLIPFDESYLILIGGNYYNEMVNQLKKMGYDEEKNIIRFFNPHEVISNYNEESLTEISWSEEREVQLNALIFLKEKCIECNVNYYLAYGSLLGAVRHKAFIPWDNDIDVFIMEKDLKKLYDTISPEDDYELLLPGVTEGYIFLTPMLVDKKTVSRIIDFPFIIKTGLGVDIFPLVGLGKTIEEAEKFLHNSYILVNDFKKKILEDGKNNLIHIHKCIDFSHKYENKDNEYIGSLFGHTEDGIHIFKKDWFNVPLFVPFENELFSIPIGCHDLLTRVYGNYMELPPREKQTSKNHPWKNYRIK